MLRMAESVATMLRGAATATRTVTVKVKFKDLSLVTRSHTLSRPISTSGAIGQVAAALLASVDPGEGIRLLGVSASGLTTAGADQLSFDLGDGMAEANESATATEQSWHDVTVARRRHPAPLRQDVGRLRRSRHRGGRAGSGPPRRPVGPRRVVGHQRIQ